MNMVGKVLRRRKALYGLKQYPRTCNIHIDKALAEFGLLRLTADSCVYAIYNGVNRVLLCVFVDDIFMIGKIMETIERMKNSSTIDSG